MHTTVRLECVLADGRVTTGTGFFFAFDINGERILPVIVTNKHVVVGSITGHLVLTRTGPDNQPLIGTHDTVRIDNFEARWVMHPDPNVDLAILPVAPIFDEARRAGKVYAFSHVGEASVASPEAIADLGGIEDVTMIGYPNGIWDAKNNLPIVRRGITATNPKHDYNGLPIFVIDCACFPGSSGSPVFIFNQGGYTDAAGNLHLGGDRILLLGVLFAGPQHVAEGEIQVIEVPLAQVPISLSKIPNNLGFVVKSSKLADFRPLLGLS